MDFIGVSSNKKKMAEAIRCLSSQCPIDESAPLARAMFGLDTSLEIPDCCGEALCRMQVFAELKKIEVVFNRTKQA